MSLIWYRLKVIQLDSFKTVVYVNKVRQMNKIDHGGNRTHISTAVILRSTIDLHDQSILFSEDVFNSY